MVSANVGMLFLLLFFCLCARNHPANGDLVAADNLNAATAPDSPPSGPRPSSNSDEPEESPDPHYEKDPEMMMKITTTNDLLQFYANIVKTKINTNGNEMYIMYKNTPDELASNDEESVEGYEEEHAAYLMALKFMHKGRAEWVKARNTLYTILNKHPKAGVEYSWMLMMMEPSEINLNEMRRHARQPGLHSLHGFMYATGIGQNVSQAKAVMHYTLGALADEPISLMALGYRFWSGVSVPASCERALHFYKRVASKVKVDPQSM